MNDIERTLSSLFSSKNREQWSNPSLWKEIVGELSITENVEEAAKHKDKNGRVQNPGAESRRKEGLVEDGYALVNNTFQDMDLVSRVASATTQLHRRKFPATFILLYDEAWMLANTGKDILTQSTHPDNVFNFDILAWYIDPSEGMAGFSPHRDRQPESKREIENSFYEGGQAKYITLWMALTDATPENSCLYVIPKQYDPGYSNGDDDGDDEETTQVEDESNRKEVASNSLFAEPQKGTESNMGPHQDPLSRALQTKQAFQNIRALPCKAGESVIFTHRILHWGSRGNSRCTEPRVAISFVSSDPLFERPYLRDSDKYLRSGEGRKVDVCSRDDINGDEKAKESNSLLLPPFEIRLLLVCAQLLIYYQRFNLPKDTIRACYEYCKEHSSKLDDTYYKKVAFEFVKAMQEEKCAGNEKEITGHSSENDDEEGDEAILEAMLEQDCGEGFRDDFDEMDDDDEGRSSRVEIEDDGFGESDEGECKLFGSSGNTSKPSKKRQKSS